MEELAIYTTSPRTEGRLEKEMLIYKVLEELAIPFWRLDHQEVYTVEEGKEIEALLEVPIYKNLFLCNKQETNFYLLMMLGYKTFKAGEISKALGSSRLSFATPQYMESFLNCTPGAATVMGLLYDKEQKIKMVFDEAILHEPFIAFHPCVNTTSIKIKTSELIEKFMPYTKHTFQYIKIE